MCADSQCHENSTNAPTAVFQDVLTPSIGMVYANVKS